MTGNISALSDHLGLAQLGWAALFSSLVAAFIAGAFVSGLLIEAGRKHAVRAIYAYSIVLEAALLVALSLIDVFLPAAQSGSILVLGLSFIMGVQNAATTRISNARVRTTHVSGMATDIGIGLALLANNSPERANVVALLRLHVSTITSFVVGGIAGVVIYLAIGDWLLLVCAVLLFAISLPEARRAARV